MGEPETKQNALDMLIQRAKTGDRSAMEELYLATYPELWRSVRAMSKNEEDAMDVMQESYLNAFTHLDELRKTEQFAAWLKKIAVNEVRLQLRKKQPLLFSELAQEEEPLLPEPVSPETPENLLIQKEQKDAVQRLLSELPDGQRTILILFYCEQYSVKEIAQQLGVSQGTVKTQLHHGRKKLENALRKEENLSLAGASIPMLLFGWQGAQSVPAQLKTGATVAKLLPQTASLTVKSTTSVVLGRIALGAAVAAIAVGVGFGASALSRFLRSVEQLPPPTPPVTEAVISTEPTKDKPFVLRHATPADPVSVTDAPALPTAPADPAPEVPTPTDPKPSEPKPTEPKSSEPKPTAPRPTEPQPTEAKPSDTPSAPPATPSDAPLQSASPADAPENQSLPTASPYPFEYQEVTIKLGESWTTSFQSEFSWSITPFAHTPNLTATNNHVDSFYSDGVQYFTIRAYEAGTFIYSIARHPDENWIRFLKITIVEEEE